MCAKLVDNSLKCWGTVYDAKLVSFLNSQTNVVSLTSLDFWGLTFLLKSDGTVWNATNRLKMNLSDIVQIETASGFLCGLTSKGSVICNDSKLSSSTNTITDANGVNVLQDANSFKFVPGLESGVVMMSSGGGTLCVIKDQGQVKCMVANTCKSSHS